MKIYVCRIPSNEKLDNMRQSLVIYALSATMTISGHAQTPNTSPLPAGETVIGNHLHAGQSNEVWTDATTLYFNYRGSAATTHFWNMGNSTGKPIMSLLNSGYVGIGVAAPASMLHINSPVERNTFRIYKSTNSSNYLSIWQGDGGAIIDPIGTGLLVLGYDQITTVSMNGKLGIGTQTPGAFLDINSNNNVSQVIQDWSITGVHVLSAGYTLGGANPVYLTTENSARPLQLQSNGGNVGIGTTSPDAKLAVSGQVHAQEVKVSITVPGPDYVFDKEYNLTPLGEIKTYIDQNKHLPEIPSAKDMEKNGVQLGEMNMLLLKKIEELTLYVIEQNKRIDDQNQLNILQQKEIEELKSKIYRKD